VLTGGAFDAVTHTFANRHDGTVTIDGSTITYTGLEPILDNLAAVDRVFVFAATNDSITLADAARANNGRLKLSSKHSSETVEFAAPTGSLTIRAGAGNDRVTIRSLDPNFTASAATLIVEGNDGDDTLDALRVLKAVMLRGDAGNDTLRGGFAGDLPERGNNRDSQHANRGNDAQSRGADNDSLLGLAGRGLLIGGAGADRLFGNKGDDLLIAAFTDYDAIDSALMALMAEWTSARSYESRIAHLSGDASNPEFAQRLNGDVFLNAETVHDDGTTDQLTGAAGRDWFFANSSQDKITDLRAGEVDRSLI
jgi:Ca2+-binding RTX toxin-like protein